ncbi:MAG: MBL fold metallo-hydrolase [Chitinophagales bacterium]|nr:MBL fold metallo-hydrolase [Chitinophagales bacterium]
MKITILGSGTSGGVPMIGCSCAVCQSSDTRDKRLRSSVLLEENDQVIVIDAGPDFRQQMLREKVNKLDAIILTHQHRDHTAGLDDIRAYNYFMGKPMDIYLSKTTEEAIRKEYHYVFEDVVYPGLPQMNFFFIENKSFQIGGVQFMPIAVRHLNMEVFGFRIHNFTYITDANFITGAEKEKIKGSEILVLNALRKQKHISHFNLEQALEFIAEVKPGKAYLTHISHQMGKHAEVEKELPPSVFLAYDGLQLSLNPSSPEVL